MQPLFTRPAGNPTELFILLDCNNLYIPEKVIDIMLTRITRIPNWTDLFKLVFIIFCFLFLLLDVLLIRQKNPQEDSFLTLMALMEEQNRLEFFLSSEKS